MLTSLANGLASFTGFRFLLGLGEAGNWPGATKAVAEWFPRRESGWAVALFDSGSSVGAALAPFIVLAVYHWSGSWRPAFIVTGSLGFLWLLVFRRVYRSAGRASLDHARGTHAHRDAGATTALTKPHTWRPPPPRPAPGAAGLLRDRLPMRRCCGCRRPGDTSSRRRSPIRCGSSSPTGSRSISCRGASGSRRASSGSGCRSSRRTSATSSAAGVSSWLIGRGWSVGAARKAVAVIGGLGMMLLVPGGLDDVVHGARGVLRGVDVRLRGVLDDDPQPAGRHLPHRLGRRRVSGMGGTGAGHRHDRRDLPHRLGRRPLLVRADPHRRQPRAARRDGGGAAARAEHRRHRTGRAATASEFDRPSTQDVGRRMQ